MKPLSLLCTVLLFLSCEKDCVTCKHEDETNEDIEVCEESGITYTDNNGNSITNDELIEFYKSIGYNCN